MFCRWLLLIFSSPALSTWAGCEARPQPMLAMPDGPRDAVIYGSALSVRIFRKNAIMGGFRFRGQYSRGPSPVFPMPEAGTASVSTDLGAEQRVKTENWYAVFAAANDGDEQATVRVMPFLRLGPARGPRTFQLAPGGEGVHNLSRSALYAWNGPDNLAGTEILVISEDHKYSGRVTSITGNGPAAISVADAGRLSQGDFLLPAPPGYDHFLYLGSFYFDTAEVRNIYDSGTIVKAKMINLRQPDMSTGAIAAPGVTMDSAGYISPLATAVLLDSVGSLSTASTGTIAEYWDPDGGRHIVDTRVFEKASNTTSTYAFGGIIVSFLYYQRFNYYNAGSIAATRVEGQLQVTGWIEP